MSVLYPYFSFQLSVDKVLFVPFFTNWDYNIIISICNVNVLLRLRLPIVFSYQFYKEKLSNMSGFITNYDGFVLTFTSKEKIL